MMGLMSKATTTFKATVSNARLKKANAVLQKLGLSAGDAFNLMLAQIEIHKALPFAVSLLWHVSAKAGESLAAH